MRAWAPAIALERAFAFSMIRPSSPSPNAQKERRRSWATVYERYASSSLAVATARASPFSNQVTRRSEKWKNWAPSNTGLGARRSAEAASCHSSSHFCHACRAAVTSASASSMRSFLAAARTGGFAHALTHPIACGILFEVGLLGRFTLKECGFHRKHKEIVWLQRI